MKNAAVFALALLVSSSAMAQSSFAAADPEPTATASEPMKTKPAKKPHHKHQRHSVNIKAHKAHSAS